MFVAKSISAQTVKDGVLTQSWVRFAAPTSFKEVAMRWSSQTTSVNDNASFDEVGCVGQNGTDKANYCKTRNYVLVQILQGTRV